MEGKGMQLEWPRICHGSVLTKYRYKRPTAFVCTAMLESPIFAQSSLNTSFLYYICHILDKQLKWHHLQWMP